MGEALERDPAYSAAWIARHYGVLVSTEDLAQLLSFPTAASVRRAVASWRWQMPSGRHRRSVAGV